MKPMLPTLTFEVPQGENWNYEVKYDGFRALLLWDEEVKLISRNGNSLLEIFPEIKLYLENNYEVFKKFLPLALDGELVYLENEFKAQFSTIQVRGRMRSEKKILEKALHAPCRLLVFDLLSLNGTSFSGRNYTERKLALQKLFAACNLPNKPDPISTDLLQLIPAYKNYQSLWEQVVLHDGEGIVAKQDRNIWEEGKRTTLWLKFKNFKYVSCFVTAYEKSNGYFYVGVYKDSKIYPIGQFLFGIKPEEKQALFQIIKENKTNEDDRFIHVQPAICLEIKYLELYDEQMREPHFERFRFDLSPEDCTFDKFVHQQKNLPQDIDITHPDKPLWETPAVKKIDFIRYLQEISPYILPFLQNRLLTVLRYPHGMFGEAFYQKNCPDYAPDFVQTSLHEGINYIVCNNLKTLLWLGNQLAFEFHIPFQTLSSKGPSEIVLDLDPPSRKEFKLAIKAAQMIKEVLDQLHLIGFVKTSGNKGLQIYIPLPENEYSYDDTRLFTEFIAEYLISKAPESFTIERLKRNRQNKLYVDYIQHAAGKTIVAPYSARGNETAALATPLFWDEVNDDLRMEDFTILNMMKRINEKGDPFQSYFETKKKQNFSPILEFLKQKK
ncbi:DNA ligase D [Robertmurraya korlensis]|jgi:bifunctional non-homologous end joining protein LigD|uniref:DNA ligase D n=1 Tax=Robertmurraya korlensis TaxID=519977 RepID=UPI0008268DAB|nr:DNA ligase D [Robertmurraya korlensis]